MSEVLGEKWLQSYVFLAFRLDTVIRRLYDWPFVTDYYGPPEWKEAVASEQGTASGELIQQAQTLLDTLSSQRFTPQRTQKLEKYLGMMETIGLKLCGVTFSLQEEMQRCWDVAVKWTSETEFEQALAIYESILPGSGPLPERLSAYEQQCALPDSQRHLLVNIVERALAETRKRTLALIPLPEEEQVTLQWFTERDALAYAGYIGNYHSLIAIDPDSLAFNLPRLLDHFICHEIYPGHHTDTVLHELKLYRDQGSIETSLLILANKQKHSSTKAAVLRWYTCFRCAILLLDNDLAVNSKRA